MVVLNLEREDGVNMALRAAREASGKTQKQVAHDVNVSEVAYQRYEYDKREPRARLATRIAKAVNSTVENIWGEDAPQETQSEPDGNQT